MQRQRHQSKVTHEFLKEWKKEVADKPIKVEY